MTYSNIERIKINVSKFVYLILMNDASSFGLVKRNGDANFNGLLNKLIPILFSIRTKNQETIHRELCKELEFTDRSNYEKKIQNHIDTLFYQIHYADEIGQSKEVIWIRPNKDSLPIFKKIIDKELEISEVDLSSYIRNLLNEYAALQQFKREQVFFASKIDEYERAIDQGLVINLFYEEKEYNLLPLFGLSQFTFYHKNYLIGLDASRLEIVLTLEIPKININYTAKTKSEIDDATRQLASKIIDECLEIDRIEYELRRAHQ